MGAFNRVVIDRIGDVVTRQNLLSPTDDAYENDAAVIRAGRERQDRKFNPLIQQLVDRYNNQEDYDKAFSATTDLVNNNQDRTRQDLQRRQQRYGIQQTRAEYDQQERDLEYQRGLSQAELTTDTAQALRNRENEILTGNSATISGVLE